MHSELRERVHMGPGGPAAPAASALAPAGRVAPERPAGAAAGLTGSTRVLEQAGAEEECLAPDRPVDSHCSVFHSVVFLHGLQLN